jgi:signal transduction histidine kinase
LLDNAIKYRDTRHALQITIRAKEENGSVVYSMADNGIGIKEEGLPDIWRVFYSRPGPCSQKGEGIGLPMSRRLVEANRGRIWAESAEGKGSTFYVEMPR